MRVTLLSPEWPGAHHVGGVARYAYRLARELEDRVELTVVTVDGNTAELSHSPVSRVLRHRGRFDRYYRLPFRLRKVVAESKPDVVHSFGDDWALPRRWPLVRTFHGSALGEARASTGLRKVNHYALSLLEHRSAQKADVRVAVGGDSMTEFRCETAMPPVTSMVRSEVERYRQPTVIFIGSFHGRKRGGLVAEAVERISARRGINVRLIVVGPQEDAANWPTNVEHYSGLDDDAVRLEVARAWVLAAPSEYEGFGIPAFEALALGTPVVSSSTPGSMFLSRMLDGTEGLELVRDDSFLPRLEAVLMRGPLDRDALPFDQVRPILELASVDRLVDEIYPLARGRRAQRSRPIR